MENKSIKPLLTVISLFAVTCLLLIFTVNVKVSMQAGIFDKLPDTLGDWEGVDIAFCHNKSCMRSYTVNEILEEGQCNNCRKELFTMSLGEKQQLPVDTTLLKKRYANKVTGENLHGSVVLSGQDRSSIHRPEVCLQGQNNDVKKELFIEVPLEGRQPLEVKILELEKPIPGLPKGENISYQYYAYWFVGKDRETARHSERMFWMGFDRFFRNVSHRWAYISVSGVRDASNEDYHTQVQGFIKDLYPRLVIDPEVFAKQ